MRREVDVTISAEGRDKGKTFHLREMAAEPAEEWATRLLLALTRSGINIPPEMLRGGMASLAALQTFALNTLVNGVGALDYDEIKPLLQQVMDCVQIKEKAAIRNLTPDDIEEVATRLFLRGEVFKLHTNFSQSAAKPA